jgi:hypothetical protein
MAVRKVLDWACGWRPNLPKIDEDYCCGLLAVAAGLPTHSSHTTRQDSNVNVRDRSHRGSVDAGQYGGETMRGRSKRLLAGFLFLSLQSVQIPKPPALRRPPRPLPAGAAPLMACLQVRHRSGIMQSRNGIRHYRQRSMELDLWLGRLQCAACCGLRGMRHGQQSSYDRPSHKWPVQCGDAIAGFRDGPMDLEWCRNRRGHDRGLHCSHHRY